MKKLLLLALLCFSVNVFAFKWEKIFVDKFGSAQYVDIEDVKKKDGYLQYWVLIDNFKPFTDGTRSSVGKWRVDCVEEKITWLSLISYSQPMGRGAITAISYHSSNLDGLTPNKILYPKSNSTYYSLMKFICDKDK